MFYGKKLLKVILLFLAVIACAFVLIPLKAAADSSEGFYLGGFPAGFVLNTTRVEVVGICEVLTSDGTASPARDAGIKTGDVIDSINGEEVRKTSDVNSILSKSFKKYEITVIRGTKKLTLPITPAKEVSSGGKRIGVLVKDSINGIGTVTYIDKSQNKFASLGHPITDAGNNLMEINGGTVFNGIIYDVKKGVRGTPGELKGAFESSVIGTAKLNCGCGVFGDLAENYDCSKLIKISKASLDEAKVGTAYIYSTVYGKSAQMYKISIVKVDKNNKDNRNFVIKVDDKELIEKTGGIVQGMSGSPIVQNGKLIGAVTHVFINDPMRGYGIGIDKMTGSY